MFDADARASIARIAQGLGVEAAALLAVAEIESAGKAFANVNGKPMPLIRWEGHYFYRLLPGPLKQQGVQAGLAHPVAGRVGNPASQQARYAMLERGKAIHEEAAIGSCSWGLGQVMGSHWKTLGYSSPQKMVDVACSGVAGQTELMARFIQKNGLTKHLKAKNWRAFARAYNGPAYKTNRYDEKMGRAYIRYLEGKPPPEIMAPVIVEYAPPTEDYTPAREEEFALKAGSSGPAVRELQEALRRAGLFVYVDGHFGVTTQKAVIEFQRKSGIAPDGRVSAETRAKLTKLQTDAVAPWWSKRSASLAGTTSHPVQKAKPQAWWEAEAKKGAWWET